MEKFLRDVNDLLNFIITRRIPEPQRRGLLTVRRDVQKHIDRAIQDLHSIDSTHHKSFDLLDKFELLGESLLVKLDHFRDRIGNSPLPAILGVANTILGSLSEVLHLDPLKELKELVENHIEHRADDEIIQLKLNT